MLPKMPVLPELRTVSDQVSARGGLVLTDAHPPARTLLEQLIRQRDATYEELCAQYDALARRMGERSSLSVRHLQRLAYGERAGQRSTPTTRRVMRELFGHPMDELLGAPQVTTFVPSPERAYGGALDPQVSAPPHGDLAERVRAATRVDSALMQAFSAQTNYLRLMDRRLAGLALAQQVAGHISSMTWLLEHSILMKHREALASELSDAQALAAWVALDLGEIDRAWAHHEAARQTAREAGSPALLAHAMVQQAFVLTEVNEVNTALDLVSEALTVAGTAVPPLMVSWLSAGEGEVQAIAGNDRHSRAAFDKAAELLPAEPTNPDLPYIQLDRSHLARWHGNALARLGDPAALDRLHDALDAPDHSLRARAALYTDLAYALAASGDHRQAQVQLTQADDFATRAGSRRQLRRIRQLAAQREYVQQRNE
jgi:hypothetical protein